MIYLVCYDMENNRLRTALSNRLQDWGMERVQKSVFVGELSEALFNRLTEWLTLTVKKIEGDSEAFSVLILTLAPGQVERSRHYGAPNPDWPYILGQTHTLIL